MNVRQSKHKKRFPVAPFEIHHRNRSTASFGPSICSSKLNLKMNVFVGKIFNRNLSDLFVAFSSQLFGEHNEDEDVSPDTEDPEAVAAAGDSALQKEANKEVIHLFCRRVKNKWE